MDYLLPDKAYRTLKWVALIVLPALATLVGAVGTAWGWPHLTAVISTITAISAFVGALIGASNASAKPDENTEPSRENSESH
ncbi:phage holin [uncultured Bifidobacterium sp.]|uniref:phage holin n=1 Tax=uncultured Bifidobacterium sp. TaxID=165187 RepID=UPI00259100E4|nr:phage holin [uncultured Bifidobacterium sp.]